MALYVPDLPGCVAVGKTAAEVKKLIAEAVPQHLEGLREDGLPIPSRRLSASILGLTAFPEYSLLRKAIYVGNSRSRRHQKRRVRHH